jgi:hypothetical protein
VVGGGREINERKEQSMKNEKHADRLLPALLAGAAVFVLLAAAASCDTTTSETPETYPDITIPYEGKTITVKGLASNDPARAKIIEAVNFILDYEGINVMAARFKNYVQQVGLIITVEDVSVYETGKNFRITDKNNEFAIRYDFVSTGTLIEDNLLSAVTDMNNIYHMVTQGCLAPNFTLSFLSVFVREVCG